RRIAPRGVNVRNMAFDVTPARYVTAIITELGAFRPGEIKKLAGGRYRPERAKYFLPGARCSSR
ncbi:MAG: hypothetical protein M0Z75_11945, partial [Nitrospiraceae bacterium]|nr:hypothetical protein [Nitrospiraceae bacterium]